jgi:hypothetical protein
VLLVKDQKKLRKQRGKWRKKTEAQNSGAQRLDKARESGETPQNKGNNNDNRCGKPKHRNGKMSRTTEQQNEK